MEAPDRKRLESRLIQLTRDLVLIESTEERPEERARCFELLRNHLDSLAGVRLTRHESNGFESLVALPTGVERPEVLLCGHLDVVHHPGRNVYRTELREGRIHGPGAGDMKGQLAILLELFREFHLAAPGVSLGLAVTSDEERGGEDGVKFLVERGGLRAGAVIIPDGGSLGDVTVEEKGILYLRVHVEGRSAHAARPWLGDNPLDRLMDGLARVREGFEELRTSAAPCEEDGPHWFPTCSVTIVETPNDSHNRIPDSASATLDLRFPPPRCSEEILAQVRAWLGPDIGVELVVGAEPTHLAPDESFIAITSEVTGAPARRVKASGGSDSRFFAAEGIPVMLSRPRVGDLHGRDEWIEIESMLDYFEICRRYILARCGGSAGGLSLAAAGSPSQRPRR